MEYPVCLADSCVGTLYVCPRGEETELRAVCRGTEKGLCRLPVSFCTISTGRTPPCSLPTTGLRSA